MPKKVNFQMPHIKLIGGYAFDTIREQVQSFEATLNPDEEVGAWLASFGHSVSLVVKEIVFADSYVLLRGTTDEGAEASLLQHYSQVSLLLIKVKRADPEKPKRRIGFIAAE